MVTLSLGTLVDVDPLEVHLHDGYGHVGGVLDMSELRHPGVNISNRHAGSKLPHVGAAAVKVRPGVLHRARILVSTRGAVEGEGGVGVVGVADPNIVNCLRVLQSPTCYGAARDALFVKLDSDLCDLWPDSPVVTTSARLRYVVQ